MAYLCKKCNKNHGSLNELYECIGNRLFLLETENSELKKQIKDLIDQLENAYNRKNQNDCDCSLCYAHRELVND